jgi:hypothetical protein
MNSWVRWLGRGAIGSLSTIAMAGGVSYIAPVAAQPPAKAVQVADSGAIASLAAHLNKAGATMYGAYWCPHCKHQKDLFGDSAFRTINYVECDPKGTNAKPDLCRAAKIEGYPTWQIKGKLYPGTQSLEDLAKLSGYKGNTKF